MVTKRKTERPAWVVEFLKSYKPPTKAQLRRRREAYERALEIREHLDIRPETTEDIVRSLRDEA